MSHVMDRKVGSDSVRDIPVAECDIIHYRTKAMDPADPERMQTVAEILPNGTMILSDGEYLRRADLVTLRVAAASFASDIGSDGPADGGNDEQAPKRSHKAPAASASTSRPPAPGTAERPLGTGAEPTLGAPRPPPASAGAPPAGATSRRHAPRVDPNGTCRDCHKPFTRKSNVQKACPDCTHKKALAAGATRRAAAAAAKGKAFAPRADATVIAARCALVAEWNTLRSRSNSAVAAAQLDTEANRTACHAKHITRDILGWYATQYRGRIAPPAPRLVVSASALSSETPEGVTTSPIPAVCKTPAEASTTNAAPPASGVPASAGPSRRPQALCDRLIAFADRLGAAEGLIARAERALQILEAYPEAGE